MMYRTVRPPMPAPHRPRHLAPLSVFGLCAALLLIAGGPVPGGAPSVQAAPSLKDRLVDVPVPFVPNAGQLHSDVRFEMTTAGGSFLFGANRVAMALPYASGTNTDTDTDTDADLGEARITLRFLGANSAPSTTGIGRLPGVVNYLRGNDPAGWRTHVPTFQGLEYRGLYPGIDLRYTGRGDLAPSERPHGLLKGTFFVAPGADPGAITWRYEGATGVNTDRHGVLAVQTGAVQAVAAQTSAAHAGAAQSHQKSALPSPVTLRESAPVAWQEASGRRIPVAARFVVDVEGDVRFAIGAYDRSLPLVIDPTLQYSTFLGGQYDDDARGVAVDAVGNAYVTGATASPSFPTQNPFQPGLGSSGAGTDAYVTKFSPAGNSLVYSTYLGGNKTDHGNAIALDAQNNIYVTGEANSTDFPTHNPAQPDSGGGSQADAFVVKLSADGATLLFGSYWGGNGNDLAFAIAVDNQNSIYIGGRTSSTNFPLMSPLQEDRQGVADGFVAKFGAPDYQAAYSTYLGGTNTSVPDEVRGVAVDAQRRAYAVGVTASLNFPRANPMQPAYGGGDRDAFVVKFNPTGDALEFGTYLGGMRLDEANAVVLSASGEPIVVGITDSPSFPLKNPYQAQQFPGQDAFIVKMDTTGEQVTYGSFLGGSRDETANGVAVDRLGRIYVTGSTASPNFPVVDPLLPPEGIDLDSFLSVFDPSGSILIFSTLIGGNNEEAGAAVAVDVCGAVVVGYTASQDFPTVNAFQPGRGNGRDGFVYKVGCFGDTLPPTATATPQGGGPTATRTSTRTTTPTRTATSAGGNGTATRTPTRTATSSGGNNTATRTPTRTATSRPGGSSTPTAIPSATSPVGSPTATFVLPPTATRAPTNTPTRTPTRTNTPLPTATFTPSVTPSPTNTADPNPVHVPLPIALRGSKIGNWPRLAGIDDPGITEMQIQNPEGGPDANIFTDFYKQTGDPVVTIDSLNVPAGATVNMLLPDEPLLKNGAYAAIVRATQKVAAVVNTTWNKGGSASYVNARPGTDIIVPLAVKDYTKTTSLVSIQNFNTLSQVIVRVRLFAVGSDVPVVDTNYTIKPGTSVTLDLGRDPDFQSVPAEFLGAMRITAPTQVAAQSFVDLTNYAKAVYAFEGVPVEEASDTLYAPLVRNNFSGLTTGISVVNTEPAPVEVTVSLTGTDSPANLAACRGKTYVHGPVTIAALSSAVFYQASVQIPVTGKSPFPAGCFGSAVIETDGGGVLAIVNDANFTIGTSAAYNAVGIPQAGQQIAIPLIRNRFDPATKKLTSGVQAMNLTNKPATMLISFRDDTGAVIPCPLSACRQVVAAFGSANWYLPTVPGVMTRTDLLGSAFLESDQPTAVIVNEFSELSTTDAAVYNGVKVDGP